MAAENSKKIPDEEIIQIARETLMNASLMDDFFMSEVLQHKEAAELVLNIILDRTDLKVESCSAEAVVSNAFAHSIRLDVLAVDAEGKRYDIEVQNIDDTKSSYDELIKRLRFYCGLIDVNCLPKGKLFKKLPDTYVIFILSTDIFGNNKPMYHICKYIEETNIKIIDGQNVIIVNSEIRDQTPLGRLMDDFHRNDLSKMNYYVLDKYTKLIKQESEVPKMSEKLQQLINKKIEEGISKVREEGREAGRAEIKIDLALSLLSENIFSHEKIAQLTKLTVEQVDEIAAGKSA